DRRLSSPRRGCKVSFLHHRPSPPSAPSPGGAGVMSVRRTLTSLAVVASLAWWPVAAHAAPSDPQRRSATGHSPAATAAAAAVAVEAGFDNDGLGVGR